MSVPASAWSRVTTCDATFGGASMFLRVGLMHGGTCALCECAIFFSFCSKLNFGHFGIVI